MPLPKGCCTSARPSCAWVSSSQTAISERYRPGRSSVASIRAHWRCVDFINECCVWLHGVKSATSVILKSHGRGPCDWKRDSLGRQHQHGACSLTSQKAAHATSKPMRSETIQFAGLSWRGCWPIAAFFHKWPACQGSGRADDMMGVRTLFDLMFTPTLPLFTLLHCTVRGLAQASTYEATLLSLKGVGLHLLEIRAHFTAACTSRAPAGDLSAIPLW